MGEETCSWWESVAEQNASLCSPGTKVVDTWNVFPKQKEMTRGVSWMDRWIEQFVEIMIYYDMGMG